MRVALAVLGALSSTACRSRPYWTCTDPEPIARKLAPPAQGWLLATDGPGVLQGVCNARVELSYGSNAGEAEIATSLSEELERGGFQRVAARPDSPWWCARRGRFHEFMRGDLRARFVVEPLPFHAAAGGRLERGEARYGVVVVLQSGAEGAVESCPRGPV